MSLTLDFQERQHLAEADRHLDTANHCLVRQLRALSTLGRHGANLSLAEAVLKTMLRTQELMVQDKERIERKLGLDGDSGTHRNADSTSKPLRRGGLEPDGEATLLLKKKRLLAQI
jgi:hypothetical protein